MFELRGNVIEMQLEQMYNFVGTIEVRQNYSTRQEDVYMECSKGDWKLFRDRISEWQEAYMEHLLKEYIDLLNGAENASDKFWKLEERIKKDKKHSGVMIELSKGNMIFDIVGLINQGVITTADLEGFSDELKESVDFLLRRVSNDDVHIGIAGDSFEYRSMG